MIIELSDSAIETTIKALIVAQKIHLQKFRDAENAHMEADDILVGLLTEMGLDDIVREWRKVKKWYA